ncbi:MAG: HAD family hydrolase [Planctomycetota bacterium]|jgi:phosphoglycolate phosphatase-like HAD superfamily hydrolase
MLALFDVDGTLLSTHGAGTRSMRDAAHELFGDQFTFDGVEVAGRIDPLIWADLCAANGIGDPDAHHDRFRSTYARHLAKRLEQHATVEILPGVPELLEALRRIEHITLGVLTGNYPETGRLKMQTGGLDPSRFAVTAWGSDGASRQELPAVAMAGYRALRGRPIDPRQVVIVGDTPHDIDCARAHGCRVLAVGTGPYPTAALLDRGADLVVDDLTATAAIVDWILEPAHRATA